MYCVRGSCEVELLCSDSVYISTYVIVSTNADMRNYPGLHMHWVSSFDQSEIGIRLHTLQKQHSRARTDEYQIEIAYLFHPMSSNCTYACTGCATVSGFNM